MTTVAQKLASFLPSIEMAKSTAIPVVAAIGGAAITVGFMSPDQVSSLTASLGQIVDGLVLIGKGAGTLFVIGGTIWAGIRRTKSALGAAVQSSKTEQVVTTDPAVAAKDPGIVLADPAQSVVTVPVPKPS